MFAGLLQLRLRRGRADFCGCTFLQIEPWQLLRRELWPHEVRDHLLSRGNVRRLVAFVCVTHADSELAAGDLLAQKGPLVFTEVGYILGEFVRQSFTAPLREQLGFEMLIVWAIRCFCGVQRL